MSIVYALVELGQTTLINFDGVTPRHNMMEFYAFSTLYSPDTHIVHFVILEIFIGILIFVGGAFYEN